MRNHAKPRALALPGAGGRGLRDGEASALSLGDLFGSLKRSRVLIGCCVLASLIVAGIYIAVARPVYEATASVRIDPGRASSLGLSDLVSSSAGVFGIDAMQTEVAILRSDVVAIETLHSLPGADFEKYTHLKKSSMDLNPASISNTPALEALLTRFQTALKVKQIDGTQLVQVSFRDRDQRLAAAIANGVVASYRKESFDSRYESVAQVSEWLSSEMGTLKSRAAEAQKKLADFQQQNEILGGDPANNTTIDRLRLLNTQLATAQSDRIVKEGQMRAAMAQDPSVLASLFPDANLSALQAQQGALAAQYAQISTKFGANYPPLIELHSQIGKINGELATSVQTARSSLREQYDASVKSENMLKAEYQEQTGKAFRLNREQAQYAVLEADGTSSRELYDTLQYKLQQAGVVAGLNGVNTIPVDTARTPLKPVEPKILAVLGFGLVSGLFVGIGAALFKESVSERAQSGEQLERVVGYPLLAIIPRFSVRTASGKQIEPSTQQPQGFGLVTLRAPKSQGAEAYRNLRSSFLLSSATSEAKTVLITSTLAREGKSSTAVNYAIVLAQKGARVLLIDGDLRRPTLHTHFGIQNKTGLTDLLLEPGNVDRFVKPLPGLDSLSLLTAGPNIMLPSEALASTRFHDLVYRWEREFDYILIDSAPLLLVSDSLPLASLADSVLLVTRYNLTPMRAITRALDILTRIDAHVAGIVLNDVPIAAANYGGNGHGYYQ